MNTVSNFENTILFLHCKYLGTRILFLLNSILVSKYVKRKCDEIFGTNVLYLMQII